MIFRITAIVLFLLASHPGGVANAFYMHRIPHSEISNLKSPPPGKPSATNENTHQRNNLVLDHLQEPIVVEEVLSLDQCERWLHHILSQSREELVLVRRGIGAELLHAKMPLELAVQEVLQKSSHNDPIRLSSIEQDLPGPSKWSQDLPVKQVIDKIFTSADGYDTETETTKSIAEKREALMASMSAARKNKDKGDKTKQGKDSNNNKMEFMDWFPLLQQHVPLQDTLVINGAGATSPVLQCHPYTKLHLCVDGSQLVRVMPPLHWQDNPTLRASARALYQEAWDGFPLSLGYQATLEHNLNMFAFRHWDVDHDCNSKELKETLEKNGGGRNIYDNFQHWAEDPLKLHPNFPVGDMIQGGAGEGEAGAFAAFCSAAAHPNQKSNRLHHDLWHSSVALAGDLIVIPAGWWYQTYHLEPSVTIESQRCAGTAMASQFIEHIIEESGLNPNLKLWNHNDLKSKAEAQEIMDSLMELLEEHYEQPQQHNMQHNNGGGGGGGPDGGDIQQSDFYWDKFDP